MQRRRTVQRDRSRCASPKPECQCETVSGKIERPDPECMIDQVQKEIDEQHHTRSELQTAQNGLHLNVQFALAADVPRATLSSAFWRARRSRFVRASCFVSIGIKLRRSRPDELATDDRRRTESF